MDTLNGIFKATKGTRYPKWKFVTAYESEQAAVTRLQQERVKFPKHHFVMVDLIVEREPYIPEWEL